MVQASVRKQNTHDYSEGLLFPHACEQLLALLGYRLEDSWVFLCGWEWVGGGVRGADSESLIRLIIVLANKENVPR